MTTLLLIQKKVVSFRFPSCERWFVEVLSFQERFRVIIWCAIAAGIAVVLYLGALYYTLQTSFVIRENNAMVGSLEEEVLAGEIFLRKELIHLAEKKHSLLQSMNSGSPKYVTPESVASRSSFEVPAVR